MIEYIAKGFLFFTHEQFIIPLIIFGYIWIDRDVFYHATCLILISMILNVALKVTFQIPLSPLLFKEGFAFPSGHMQSAVTFFGWIIFKNHSWFVKLLLITILIGIGFGLIYFQYHNFYDVTAAGFFGFFLIFLYNKIIQDKSTSNNINSLIIIFVTTVLLAYIFYKIKQIRSHIWMSYVALISFIFSDSIFKRRNVSLTWKQKALYTIGCFSSIFIIMLFFSNQKLLALPLYLINLIWVFIFI